MVHMINVIISFIYFIRYLRWMTSMRAHYRALYKHSGQQQYCFRSEVSVADRWWAANVTHFEVVLVTFYS